MHTTMPEYVTMSDSQITRRQKPTHWAARLLGAGILFFAIKGMLWLMIPAILLVYHGCSGT